MNPRQILVFVLFTQLAFVTLGERVLAAERWKQKEFFITFWSPPPATDEALSTVAAEGFNFTWTPAEGLDVAARHGLRAMLMSELLKPETLENEGQRAKLDALIQQVKTHHALEAYYITDEPGAGAFPGLGKLVAYLRERDPRHFAYINLFPTYANEEQLGVSADSTERAKVGYPQNFSGVGADDKTVLRYREHLKKFVEIVQPDLLSYDHYHFLKTGDGLSTDGSQYFLNLALIRLAALEAKIPFVNVIQANTIEPSWRLPNASEMRWLAFTTMAYGGRGINYFTYWGPKSYNGLYQDGKASPLAKDVGILNKDVAKFGAALMKLESVAAYQTAPLPLGAEAIRTDSPVQIMSAGEFVVGLFKKAAKTNAFLIVNRNYRQDAEASLKISMRGREWAELDRKTGKWSKFTALGRDGVVKVKLSPGDGRLFSAE
ncbi:MAG: hypothetical protein ABIQ35_12675 [Verrucomicrobiota bacterium]